jgi:hypothetical protein
VESNQSTRRKRGSGSATKHYELAFRDTPHINAALSDETDVSRAAVLECNTHPQRVFQGVTPGHKGFLLDAKAKKEMLERQHVCSEIIHPYLGGDEILSGNAVPTRFLIDFEQRTLMEAQACGPAFHRVQHIVLPARRAAAEEGRNAAGEMRSHHKQFLERWWQLSWGRAEMVRTLAPLPRYLVCSRVTKRPVFLFLHKSIRPGDALQVFAFADDYSFGILQSAAHWAWFVAKCSKLTERFRYTPESVFDTFPWPQTPTKAQVDAIAAAGREIRAIRAVALKTTNGGLRAIYRTLELPGANPLRDAHTELDEAVRNAYGFSKRGAILASLLDLNREVATAHPTAPGIPRTYRNPDRLISTDSLGA